MDRLISLQAAIDALEMAIQALSSKGDMVYRQATIDTVVAWTVEDKPDIEMPTDLIDRIKNMPSAQPEPQWIPCSERLPEESGRYLISALDGIGRRTTVAPYQPRYKAWTMTGRMAYWKVIAWMPLIEPYQPKENEQ